MRNALHPVCFSLALLAVSVIACGSSSDSLFKDGQSSGDPGAGTDPFGTGSGASGGNGASGGTGASGGVGNVGNVDPNAACATSNAGAALPPISLVFMIDKSGSMANDNGTNTLAVRWEPVVSGLSTFFGDAKSSNITASLGFFALSANTPTNKSCQKDSDCNNNQDCIAGKCNTIATTCDVSAYQNAVVPMTQLPNAAPFTTAFGQTSPGGRTPTAPALTGAINAAKVVKDQGKNVAVVLATDGEPNDCNSSVTAVENAAAAGVAAGVKTYVIGVGPSTGNLNSFAAKGGTTQAIMIPTNNTAQVSADLINALGQIASSLLGCEYGLPKPPDGQTLNVNAVNVNYTAPGAASKTLPYSADCANPDGWHYDSTQAPSKVVLCTGSCGTAQAQSGAKLDIIFGCGTAVPSGGTDPNGNVVK
jgi:hypothetical protein